MVDEQDIRSMINSTCSSPAAISSIQKVIKTRSSKRKIDGGVMRQICEIRELSPCDGWVCEAYRHEKSWPFWYRCHEIKGRP